MEFGGFQKLTLLDFPQKVACILFTKGCNMRCPFCHNNTLVTTPTKAENIDESEVLEYLQKRTGILEGVVVTGGEPLLHNSLGEFLKKVKDLGYAVKLDTNGTYPDKLIKLVNDGLVDYVAMDIKNSFEKYAETCGTQDIVVEDIQKSIDFLINGEIDYEFRTTVVQGHHTPEDIEKISLAIKGAKKYFLQNFVDSGDTIKGGLSAVSTETMAQMCAVSTNNVNFCEIR